MTPKSIQSRRPAARITANSITCGCIRTGFKTVLLEPYRKEWDLESTIGILRTIGKSASALFTSFPTHHVFLFCREFIETCASPSNFYISRRQSSYKFHVSWIGAMIWKFILLLRSVVSHSSGISMTPSSPLLLAFLRQNAHHGRLGDSSRMSPSDDTATLDLLRPSR